jgi:hypothetical protein
MLMFSQSTAWFTAATLMGVVSSQTASAQQQPPGNTPGANVTASASMFGGYDTDISRATLDPSLRASAPHAGTILTLNYRRRTEKIGFSIRANADSRHYRTDQPVTATSFNGSAIFGVQATPRLKLDASASSGYSPQFLFSLLPQTSDIPTEIPPPSLDYGVSLQDSVTYAAGTTATYKVSARSSLTMSYGRSQYRFLGGDYDQYNSKTQSYGGGYSYNVTKYAALRVGYIEQTGEYPAFGGMPRSLVRQRSIDAGVNYSRPLSISRRTTFSFGTGSAAIDDGVETFYTVTGNATLRHQIGRTWNTVAMYTRGLGVVGGFAQPFFADAVSLELRGMLTPKVSAIAMGGYANGNVGLGSRGENYRSYQGTARIEMDLKRERVGLFGSYFYYGYGFENALDVAPGVPSQIGRHGIRGGLIVRVPIVEERTPRVTR